MWCPSWCGVGIVKKFWGITVLKIKNTHLFAKKTSELWMVHKAHNTENCKQWHKWLSHCHRYHLENFLWAIQTKLSVDINWTGITAAASAMFTTVLLYNLSSGNWLLLHEPAVSHIHTFIAALVGHMDLQHTAILLRLGRWAQLWLIKCQPFSQYITCNIHFKD